MDEKELELLRKGISRCNHCEVTKRKLKCPRYKESGFCSFEIQKLSKIDSFEGLQEQIVISFGELLILLTERTKIRSSFGSVPINEMREVAGMLSKWITGTRTRQKLAFQKRDFSKLLSGDDDKDE